MAIQILSGKRPLPPRIFLYGGPGVGKTTAAASVPGMLVMPVEEGADTIDVAKTPVPKTWDEAMAMLDQLGTDQQGFRALAIDSVTALQELAYQHVCAEQRVPSIEGVGYGKGYVMAAELWRQFLSRMDIIRRKMIVLLIGHSTTKKHEDPRLPAWDRMVPRLQINGQGSGIGPMTVEWCDVVAACCYQVFTTEDKAGANKERTRAMGDGERVLYLQERPAFLAKNRYALPPEMPLDMGQLIGGIKAALTTAPVAAQPATEASKGAA